VNFSRPNSLAFCRVQLPPTLSFAQRGILVIVALRFYIDPETGQVHIRLHGVTESEVEQVLERPVEDRAGREGSRVAIGQTRGGRYLRVIYVIDSGPNSVFIITAYELRGKPLGAFRRRRRKRQSP
jgi:Domain of unknown function (DUF4258)